MSKTRFTALCITGLALGVSACAVGPDFSPPLTEVPAKWIGAPGAKDAESMLVIAPITAGKWWRTFNDAKLTALIEDAFQKNLDLKQAVSRIRQSRAAYRAAMAGLFPAVSANASYRRGGGRAGTLTAGLPGDAAGSDMPGTSSGGGVSELFSAGLDASWEIDIFGGIRRDVERAGAELEVAEESRRDVLVSLAAEVALNYFELRGLQQQIAITKKNLEAQKGVLALTRERYQAGFANALDTANAEAQVATTLAALPPLEAAAAKAGYALSVLLAEEPGALSAELEPASPVTPPPEVPVSMPSELLKRRPDIRRAAAALHAATAAIGVAEADLFPRFSLTALVNWQGENMGSLGRNRSWSLLPGVSYPLFDAGRIRANIDIQNELQAQSLLDYEKAVLNALLEVEGALIDYQREQERRRALAESVTHNQKALQLSRQLYVAGTAEFLNVLTAERSLYASEDALVQSTRTINTNLVALYKALGGGWEE